MTMNQAVSIRADVPVLPGATRSQLGQSLRELEQMSCRRGQLLRRAVEAQTLVTHARDVVLILFGSVVSGNLNIFSGVVGEETADPLECSHAARLSGHVSRP